MNPTKMMNFHKKWIPLLLLCNIMVLTVMMPLIAYAQESDQKNVRVGWYESPFNYTDQNGRRSGYAYEYQKKVAAYTAVITWRPGVLPARLCWDRLPAPAVTKSGDWRPAGFASGQFSLVRISPHSTMPSIPFRHHSAIYMLILQATGFGLIPARPFGRSRMIVRASAAAKKWKWRSSAACA